MEDRPGSCMGKSIGEMVRGIEVAQDEPVVLALKKVPAVPAFCKDPV